MRLDVLDGVGCGENVLAGRISSKPRGISPAEMEPWIDVALRFAEDIRVTGTADHIRIIQKALRNSESS